MVPASDDSQTNSCLKNPILMRIRAGYSLRLRIVGMVLLMTPIRAASAFPLKINYGDDVLVLPRLLLLLRAHHP